MAVQWNHAISGSVTAAAGYELQCNLVQIMGAYANDFAKETRMCAHTCTTEMKRLKDCV